MTEEQLNGLGYTFPIRLNILLTRDKVGKFSIIFSEFNNKKINLSNIKHNSTGVWFFDGTSNVSLGVYDFKTFEEFYKKIDELNERWIRVKLQEVEG